MCEPTTIIAATSAVLGAAQQDRNARKQRRAIRQQQDQEEREINRANSLKADNQARKAKAARAKIKARAAGTGESGLTIDTLLNNTNFQLGTDLATIEGNRELEVKGSQARERSNLNSVRSPDWLGAGLQIAGAVTNRGQT